MYWPCMKQNAENNYDKLTKFATVGHNDSDANEMKIHERSEFATEIFQQTAKHTCPLR